MLCSGQKSIHDDAILLANFFCFLERVARPESTMKEQLELQQIDPMPIASNLRQCLDQLPNMLAAAKAFMSMNNPREQPEQLLTREASRE